MMQEKITQTNLNEFDIDGEVGVFQVNKKDGLMILELCGRHNYPILASLVLEKDKLWTDCMDLYNGGVIQGDTSDFIKSYSEFKQKKLGSTFKPNLTYGIPAYRDLAKLLSDEKIDARYISPIMEEAQLNIFDESFEGEIVKKVPLSRYSGDILILERPIKKHRG
jgi:hypothetical protein